MRLLIVLILCLFLVGCDNTGNPQSVNTNLSSNLALPPVNYGNGVYYFDCTRHVFGNSLSSWMKDNPNFQVLAIAGNDTGGNGFTAGYFVVVKEMVYR